MTLTSTRVEVLRWGTVPRIRGTAEQAAIPPSYGAAGDELETAIIRVTPRRIISFGIDDQVSEPHQLTVDIRDV